jgi:hypothetical protein
MSVAQDFGGPVLEQPRRDGVGLICVAFLFWSSQHSEMAAGVKRRLRPWGCRALLGLFGQRFCAVSIRFLTGSKAEVNTAVVN